MSFDFQTLVTDRNQSDVSARNEKGTYNAPDLNRVTEAMEELNALLLAAGYISGYTPLEINRQTITPPSPLPDGYTQLEYIESTGTQYIVTDKTPNSDSRIFVKFTADGSAQAVVGSETNWLVDGFAIYSSFTDVGNARSSDYNGYDGNPHVVSIENGISYFDGTQVGQVAQSFTGKYPIALFTRNRSGSFGENLTGRIFYCTFYQNQELTGNFIPCKNPSNAVGVFDTVSQTFFPNSGTGEFNAGPAVIPEPEPDPRDPYTWYETDVVTEDDGQKYLGNVSSIRDTLSVFANTPTAPSSLVGINYTGANDIESILLAVKQIYDNMTGTVNLAWTIGLADVGLYGGI